MTTTCLTTPLRYLGLSYATPFADGDNRHLATNCSALAQALEPREPADALTI